ncbi:MAG: putative hydrolase [Actinomycetia bacterium]|nr:putative hydrolase [Actinomycetes bacterium]
MTVCAHHHLYSGLYRYLPGPAREPQDFTEILELVWWRLDVALTLDDIEWSTKLAALEALELGCTAIIDHHESPSAIEGSLDVIAAACAEVGVRVRCAYGVTDRHGPDGAKAGLAENERFLRAGGDGLVGVHAAFTCTDETLEAAAGLAVDLGVGVHIHVAEGTVDAGAADRLRPLTRDDWLLVHGVHLADDHGLRGTIVHCPRSNRGNGVGAADPERFRNPVALGTDGIDADMAAEARAAGRLGQRWLAVNDTLFPDATGDLVLRDGGAVTDVTVGDDVVLRDGEPTRVDAEEIRAKAAERGAALARRW